MDMYAQGQIDSRAAAAAARGREDCEGQVLRCCACCGRAWRKEADGTCVLVSSSVDCDEVPRVAGKVRAELRDCGYICAPAPGPTRPRRARWRFLKDCGMLKRSWWWWKWSVERWGEC
eukprot:232569-Rhodomonas_salina.2